eukprot:1756556-Pyramimonas_sp.AAC.1
MVASLGSVLQGLALQLDNYICADDACGIGWWRAQLRSLPTEVEGPDALTGAISTRVSAAWKAARSLSRARMKDWLLKALPKGAKKGARLAFWSQVWDSPDGMSLLSGVLDALRPRALMSLE